MKIPPSALLNIILATVLVTSMFFMSTGSISESVETGASNYETAMQLQEYDPWIDVDDTGTIDVFDVVKVLAKVPSMGDPTKPVIIAGYNWSQVSYDFWLTPGEEGNLSITTAGYKQIILGFKASPEVIPSFGNVTVATGFLIEGRHLYVDRFNVTLGWTGPQPPIVHEYPVVKTYDIKGRLLTIAYYNPNEIAYQLLIEGYMTT